MPLSRGPRPFVPVLGLIVLGAGCHGRSLDHADGAPGADVASDRGDTAPAQTDTAPATPDAGADVAPAADAADAHELADVPKDLPPAEVSAHVTQPKYLGTSTYMNTGDEVSAAYAPDGSLYLTGAFRQPTDLDPGPGKDIRIPQGVSNAFITKLDAAGRVLWTRSWGGDGSQTFTTTIAASATSVVVGGAYTEEVDFDPGVGVQKRAVSASSAYTGFVLALTSEGDFSWVSTLPTTSDTMPRGVALGVLGDVFVAGGCNGICDLDPGPGVVEHTSLDEHGYVLALAALDGHRLWSHVYEGGDACAGFLEGVAVAPDGLVWTTGRVSDGCSFGGRAAPADVGDQGAGLASFRPTGEAQGLWTIPGGDGTALAIAGDGSLYWGGGVAGVTSTDFDPGPGTEKRMLPPDVGDPTAYVVKLGPGATPAFRWVQTYARSQVASLAATEEGGVIALVLPVPDLNATTAFVVLKLDASQATPWGLPFPGTNAGAFMVAAHASSFVVTGMASGVMDVDPGASVDLVIADQSFYSRYAF